ncbi:hypothetical protein [Aestuariivirga sp.]|uniref:hypothetical protein n=1 Tax=Aestuariivirga sp. TaxID=2650926 RepID=UPI0039E33197
MARLFAFLLLTLFIATPLRAETLQLQGKARWIAIASSKDLDEAIGIAQLYADPPGRVVSSKSGWYGVVIGPVKTGDLAAYRKSYQGWPELPKDAHLSTGANYLETVWQPKAAAKPAELVFGKPVEATAEGLPFRAELKGNADSSSVEVSAASAGHTLFTLSTKADQYAETGSTLAAARLDPTVSLPQAILSRFTGGAHCCVDTTFFTETAAGWQMVNGLTLDGGGYGLEDFDGDGADELTSVDNAFLYAFDSYAASFAPMQIWQLRGGKIANVTKDEKFRAALRRDLAGMEFQVKLNPELLHARGYLAAWVATKIELGEGDAAWKVMLANYEKTSDFETQVCTTGGDVNDCPQDKLKTVPFPEALAAFLKQNGYTPVPGN